MKVITFSRVFPVSHPRKGEPTGFEEKIISGDKKHTIRAGNRWKVGERFSARVWSGKPYASKQQEIIGAPIEIKKIWEFEYNVMTVLLNGRPINWLELQLIAENDGLSIEDFKDWFEGHRNTKHTIFKGQVICWDETVEY